MDEKELESTILQIHIKNSTPVSLDDLSISMRSLANEFANFCKKRSPNEEAKLYVQEVRKGSIVIDLISSIPAFLPLVEGANTIVEFGKHLHGTISFIKGLGNKPDTTDDNSIRNIENIASPIVKDNQSNMTISVNNCTNSTVIVNASSSEMRDIQNKAINILESGKQPNTQTMEKAVIELEQIRKSNDRNHVGDKGVISAISEKPVKLIVIDENFKKSIVENEENAFDFLYVADIEVVTASKKIVAYRITKFHERFRP